MKVLITPKSLGKLSRKPIQRSQDAGSKVYGDEKGRLLNEEEVAETIQGVDAVILGIETFNHDVIDHTDKLKIVSCYSVGLNKIDVGYLKERGIILQTTCNVNASSVADHIIGLMLSLCRNITRSDANIRSHVWRRPIAKDLCQGTVGIPGLGAVGKTVARGLERFDCYILVFDSYYDEAFIREYGIRKVDINEIVNSSDFLMPHLPASTEFSPLLDAKVLSKVKKNVVITNTARTRLIGWQAPYDVLHNRRLYGYSSDVHYMEPGLDEEPIACENTVLAPYITVSNEGTINCMLDIATDYVLIYFSCQ